MKNFCIGLVLFISIMGLGIIIPIQHASAATSEECYGNTSIPILPKWYKYVPHNFDGSTNSCEIMAEFPKSIPAILLAVFEILLRISGILAVVFIVYGGFQYLTSTGEPDKAKAARTTIMNALIGMMIAMFATVIVNLVGNNIG